MIVTQCTGKKRAQCSVNMSLFPLKAIAIRFSSCKQERKDSFSYATSHITPYPINDFPFCLLGLSLKCVD